MKITKRDGTRVDFDKNKIKSAITKANEASGDVKTKLKPEQISSMTDMIYNRLRKRIKPVTVEEVQDIVETELMKAGAYDVAKTYVRYRYRRGLARDQYTDLMDAVSEKIAAKNVQNQNANLDEKSFGGRMGETTSMVLKQYALDYCMSDQSRNNHLNNEVYIHDLDHYALGDHNCLSIPFDDLLANGFTTRQVDIRPAGSVNTAFQLVAVIMQIQSLCQFGFQI